MIRSRRHFSLAAAGSILAGCSTAPQVEEKPAFRMPSLPHQIAEDVRFPSANRKSVAVVETNLLGYSFLSGGNLATYQSDTARYLLFLIRCKDASQAGVYLTGIKGELKDPKFVASYGAYFSQMPNGPLFIFAKGIYLAGIVGLPEDDAVQTGKEFAARL